MSAPPRGLGLIEVLVAGALGSIIVAGSMKSLTLSLQTAQVARSALTELELKSATAKALSTKIHCGSNLKPQTSLKAGANPVTDPLKGVGIVQKLSFENQDLITSGEDFKGDLRIVKMALKGDESQDPKGSVVNRVFVIYYKKNNLGVFNTVGNAPCTVSDQAGCYHHQCQIQYSLSAVPNTEGNYTVETCQRLDCSGDLPVHSTGCHGNTYFKGFNPWTGKIECALTSPFSTLKQCPTTGQYNVGTTYWDSNTLAGLGESLNADKPGDISCQEIKLSHPGGGGSLHIGAIVNGTVIKNIEYDGFPLNPPRYWSFLNIGGHCVTSIPKGFTGNQYSKPHPWYPLVMRYVAGGISATNSYCFIHPDKHCTSHSEVYLTVFENNQCQVHLAGGIFKGTESLCPEGDNNKGYFWNSNLCTCDRVPQKPIPAPPQCAFELDFIENIWPGGNSEKSIFFKKATGVLAGTHKYNLFCANLLTANVILNFNTTNKTVGNLLFRGSIKNGVKTAVNDDYYADARLDRYKNIPFRCPDRSDPTLGSNQYWSSFCRNKRMTGADLRACMSKGGHFLHLPTCTCRSIN